MTEDDVTSRPKCRHVSTVACPWMKPNFSKSSQEPATHHDTIAHLKNGNSKSNLETWFLNFLTLENLPKIWQNFVYKLDLNPLLEKIVYTFNNHKSHHEIEEQHLIWKRKKRKEWAKSPSVNKGVNENLPSLASRESKKCYKSIYNIINII